MAYSHHLKTTTTVVVVVVVVVVLFIPGQQQLLMSSFVSLFFQYDLGMIQMYLGLSWVQIMRTKHAPALFRFIINPVFLFSINAKEHILMLKTLCTARLFRYASISSWISTEENCLFSTVQVSKDISIGYIV